MTTLQWGLFVLGTTSLAFISRKSLVSLKLHGFYRFFAWEILLIILLNNLGGWFRDLFAWYQLISWVLLIISLILVSQGVKLLRTIGRQNEDRSDPSLLGMEKTSQLVTIGLYRYIRHPLYSSLLFLAWGVFFKSPSWLDAGLMLLVMIFLVATAYVEERENISYFGDEYVEYMKHSKMFVPFLF